MKALLGKIYGKGRKGEQIIFHLSLAKVHLLDFNFPILPSWLLDPSGQPLEKLEPLGIHSVGPNTTAAVAPPIAMGGMTFV